MVDTGSASAAARACFITQPSLSRQIAQLEREVGTPLFRRTASGLRLTGAGSRLVPIARDIGLRMDRATSLMRSLAGGELALTVACPPPLAVEVFAPLIVERGTPIGDVHEVAPDQVYRQLEAGADLAFGTLDPPPGLARQLVFTAGVYAHAPAGSHPFHGRSRIEARELVDVPLILPYFGWSVRQAVDRALAEHGLELHRTHEVGSSTLARSLAAAGRGVALLVGRTMYELERVSVVHDGVPLVVRDWAAWEPDHYAATDIERAAEDIRSWMHDNSTMLGAAPGDAVKAD